MDLDKQLFKYLAVFILLSIGAGAQAEVADKPEWSMDFLPRQNKAWCSLTPYSQQHETRESIANFPQANKAGWSIGSTSGVIWGKARELVFENTGVTSKNDYLSELIWELNRVFVLGVDSFWQGKKSNGLELRLDFAIPNMPAGKMDDYDWYYTDRDWSHWSQSEATLRLGFIFDFLYEEVLVRSGRFNLKVGAGYHIEWWSWRDKLTDSLYSTFVHRVDRSVPDKFSHGKGDKFRDRPDVLTVGSNGINYWVIYQVPSLSLRSSFEWDTISLSALVSIGPMLGIAKDHHLKRFEYGSNGVYFYDVAFGGPWVGTTLEVGFKITDRLSFLLRGEFAWLRETRGSTITVPTNEKSVTIANKAGGLSFRRIGVNSLILWKL
ncbi:hypothetical protein S1OALGB6SA_669 [Olavius algarvensis spirochete endosymbiont]|uniref:omptin family outer membrane protease n=1 Tax=Olavius algarvensis spirochete endosymbiont TaxID=260710 RepID=UPI000F2496ED|nr:omptin family outer membrane protease [Olavius algarvensis spirochete endosymbiont]CAD7841447.1 MAG: hypothetical protein [Olavius algarvensis spirochete endosymbiont]VDA99598.1 hypothetical protein S1OALGB6SA_669 [Olavius algarvensis spirochete endosymbiont]